MDNKKKHRFNLIDIFVIFIVLALIGGTAFFAFRKSRDVQSQIRERNITYTVCLSGVSEAYLSAFGTEEHMLNSATLNYIGTISKIKTEKHGEFTEKAVQNNLGSNYILVQNRYEDIFDVYLTVTAKTTLDERGVAYIDGRRITVGSPINIRCGNFAHAAYITNFSIS